MYSDGKKTRSRGGQAVQCGQADKKNSRSRGVKVLQEATKNHVVEVVRWYSWEQKSSVRVEVERWYREPKPHVVEVEWWYHTGGEKNHVVEVLRCYRERKSPRSRGVKVVLVCTGRETPT